MNGKSNAFGPSAFFIAILLLLAGNVKAEVSFTATLTGTQEVPPNSSTARGFGIVTLNDAETQIRFSLTFSGLGSNQTAAHIHGPAPIGANAPVLFNVGSSGAASGTFRGLTQTVTPAQVQDLKNGLWYFNVHSVNFPNGEIRGQILPASPFIANLTGAQEVPATSSTATGIGKVFLNAAEDQIVTSLGFSGLSTNQTASHIHGSATSIPGVNAGIVFDTGSSGATSGSFLDLFFAITPTQLALLKSGRFYFNVHSTAFPGGEIRGQIKPANKYLDFDGDSRADIGVFRPSEGVWYRLSSANNNFVAQQFGLSGDVRVPGDFDLDGKMDLNVWRNGTFFTLLSSNNAFRAFQFGTSGDDPRICADYDGDGITDYAVFRPSNAAGAQSVFYYQRSTRGFGAVAFGTQGDTALIADWDGDRVSDPTVYRPGNGTYFGLLSSNGALYAQKFGVSATDSITTGDVDADGKSDPIVYRFTGPEAGTWYVLGSATGFSGARFGLGSDTPVNGDFDGDGRTDFSVYRPSEGTWYFLRTTSGFAATRFGLDSDTPFSNYLFR